LKQTDLDRSRKHLSGPKGPPINARKRPIVTTKTIRILLDTGMSSKLHLIKKGFNKYIPTVKRAVPQSWGTSTGTFQTKKVAEIDISLVEYSASNSVQLTPDIV
jgi:hypothetical protein